MRSPIRLTEVEVLGDSLNKDAVSLNSIIRKRELTEMFNFMISPSFVYEHVHPDAIAKLKTHFVYGYCPGSSREDPTPSLREEIATLSHPDNVVLHRVKLNFPMQFPTHHSKLMILFFKGGDECQVVIHTANMIALDWTVMTNGVWLSPRLKKRDSKPIQFQRDLIDYLNAYRNQPGIKSLANTLSKYDFSEVRATLIASVPGMHTLGTDQWGIRRLQNELRDQPTDGYVIAQFSSVATLGPKDTYFTPVIGNAMGCTSHNPLKVIFPTLGNIQQSIYGYASGGSIRWRRTEKSQLQQYSYMLPNMHSWRARKAGRDRAAPHIKTYCRVKPDGSLGWFLLTSANLSKQAWGQLPRNRNYQSNASWEIGVLLTPDNQAQDPTDQVVLWPTYNTDELDPHTIRALPPRDTPDDGDDLITVVTVPIRMAYDIPLTPYFDTDIAWTPDEPHSEEDWLGNAYP